MRASVLLACALALCAAGAAEFEGDEIMLACRPGMAGDLACRVVAEENIEDESPLDPASSVALPMEFFSQSSNANFVQSILGFLRNIASSKNCGSATSPEGVPVDFCVKRHIHRLQLRYSADVTIMGVTASSRDFGGSDTKSPKGAIELAGANWARKYGG